MKRHLILAVIIDDCPLKLGIALVVSRTEHLCPEWERASKMGRGGSCLPTLCFVSRVYRTLGVVWFSGVLGFSCLLEGFRALGFKEV